jgi:RNA-directed DNA polymerase
MMTTVTQKIMGKRVPKLIRRFLEAGITAGAVVMVQEEGTPKDGPLSPLPTDIVLDDLDKELEKRGRCFVRYADDCDIYVKSRQARERVMVVSGWANDRRGS